MIGVRSGDPRRDYYVYCYENLLNGMRYYGKGQGNRITAHLKMRGSGLLCKAIKKHGIHSFNVYKLVEGLTSSEALEMEIVSIARHRTNRSREYEPGVFGHGYNLTDGGDGTAGFKLQHKKVLSSEHKAKIKAGTRGWTPEAIEKGAAKRRGRPLSLKHREALSAAQRNAAARKRGVALP